MERPTLWQRLVRARVAQMVVVYLGAAWGIIEVTGALTDALSLPTGSLPSRSYFWSSDS